MVIETYKGFEITLDTSTGKFTGDGATSRSNSEFESTSLKTIKTKINTFIKENQSFGEFKVRRSASGNLYDLRKLKQTTLIKGVTSNKRLTMETPEGKSGTIGKYDIDNFVIYNEDDDKIIDSAIELDRELKEIQSKFNIRIKGILSEIKEVSLKDFLIQEGIEVDMRDRGY